MPAPFTDADVLRLAPYGANGVTLTPSGTGFANSAWAEVEAATSTPWVLVGVNPVPPQVNAIDAEIEVGVGAAGSEVPIGHFSARTGSAITLGGLYGHTDHFSSILINRIPAGSRVAVRLRKSGTDTTAWRVKLAYYAGPLTGTFNVTSIQGPVRLPASAASITVATPASAWGNSSYAAISAALPFACVLLGANIELNANGPRFEVDLAIGPSGSEVPIATLWENSGNTSGGLYWFPFKTPLGPFNAGTRLTMRARDSSSSALDAYASVLVLPYPY